MNRVEMILRGISRNWRRYAILAMAAGVAAAGMTVAAVIGAAAEKITEDYAGRIGVRVSFTPDLRKVFAQGTDENGYMQLPEITAGQMEEFSQSDLLKATLYTLSLQAYGEDIQAVGQELWEDSPGFLSFVPKEQKQEESLPIANCLLIAYSDISLAEEFSTGLREIVRGNFPEESGAGLVSEEFAEQNHLQIGDSIQVCNTYGEGETISLDVTGIYSDEITPQTGGYASAVNNRRNEIVVSYGTLNKEGMTAADTVASYYLKSPEDAEAFEMEVREKGLSEIYNVNVDAGDYYMVTEPVKGLQRVMKIMFSIVTAAGLAIFALLSLLQAQERKYELGILRAMGMGKGAVIVLMLAESVIVCGVGLCLGLGCGSCAAQPIFDAALGRQIRAAEESKPDYAPDYGEGVLEIGNESVNGVPMEHYEIQAELTGRAFGTAIVCVLSMGVLVNGVCLCFWVRREPMRLLIER